MTAVSGVLGSCASRCSFPGRGVDQSGIISPPVLLRTGGCKRAVLGGSKRVRRHGARMAWAPRACAPLLCPARCAWGGGGRRALGTGGATARWVGRHGRGSGEGEWARGARRRTLSPHAAGVWAAAAAVGASPPVPKRGLRPS
eukprot:3702204-Prymnesium_polylepis.1